jgi:hypothetical protein
MANLINEAKRMQQLAGILTESQLISEGVKLDILVKDGKPNSEILVVPNKRYSDKEELDANTMRPLQIKKEEGRKDMMVFTVVGRKAENQQYPIEGDEVADIITYEDAKKNVRESQLNEEVINFKDKDQYADFLQNKTKELENSKIKLKIYDTFSSTNPQAEKFTGFIIVSDLKRTNQNPGKLIYDCTLVDNGGYKVMEPLKGKKISLDIPASTGDQGSFRSKDDPNLAGLFKVETLEILGAPSTPSTPAPQAESLDIEEIVNEALKAIRK